MSSRRQWLRGLGLAIGASVQGGAVRAFAGGKPAPARCRPEGENLLEGKQR